MDFLGGRGSDGTLQIIVDGDAQGGSFLTLESWEIQPRETIDEVDTIGEKTQDHSYQLDGYDFNFKFKHVDKKIFALHRRCVDAYEAGLPQPNINIILRTKHRNPAEPQLRVLCSPCVLKTDSFGAGGRKEFLAWTLSGKCRSAKEV